MIRFLETSVFTRQITAILADEEYAELQAALVLRPEFGVVIQGTGGLRKVRWAHAGRGKGKRGGVRVIYYWYQPGELVYMLLAYSKGSAMTYRRGRRRSFANWSRRSSDEERAIR